MNSVFSTSHRFQFQFNGTTTVTSLKQRRKHFFVWISVTVFIILVFTHFANSLVSIWCQITSPVFHQIYNKAFTSDDCPPGSFYYCSSSKKCLLFSQHCDRYQDCSDDFDETNCQCLKEEYSCKNGRCISELFMCDGVLDCPEGDDETEKVCKRCATGEYRCEGLRHVCLRESQVCNERRECSLGDDEKKCVVFKKNNELRLRVSSTNETSICYDSWSNKFSDYFCEKANKGFTMESFPLTQKKNSKFSTLKNTTEGKLTFTQSDTCPNEKVVGLRCYEEDCGKRKVDDRLFRAYLIYGKEILQGEFPWYVYLKCNGFTCGASLIGDRWVLTAGHCVYLFNMDGSRCNVYMGSVYSLENKWTYFEVEKIILREDYVDTEFKNDIALLKLKTPVVYTPYIQPICLPHKRYSEKDYQDCYSVGIGKTIKDRGSEKLMKSRMAVNHRESTTKLLCIGTSRGKEYPNICMGDSGGPFMCRKKNENIWVLIGIHIFVRYSPDYGKKPTSKMCQLSFAERVINYVGWIRKKQIIYS